jgi:UDP-N-acetylmuramoylalanine--D-glutamate ligase
VLNVTEDHLDRYAGLDHYATAKARVFQGEGVQILNRDDPRVLRMALPGRKKLTFSLSDTADFYVRANALVWGDEKIIDAAALPIRGWHNAANALAACALASTLGVSLDALSTGLRTFKGLPHRLELVRTRRGVEWYDDSKGTNVGATIAALKGLAKPTVLILGGEGKGRTFRRLQRPQGNSRVRCCSSAVTLQSSKKRLPVSAVPRSKPRWFAPASSHARRGSAAFAGMRELRHVSRLQASRRGLRRGSAGAPA